MRAILVGLSALIMTACTTTQGPPAPSQASTEPTRFETYQVARFAAARPGVDFRSYQQKHKGKLIFTFDDVHRHPFLPEGPTVVDCATTRFIGVRFLMLRKARLFLEKVNWNVAWRHEDADGLVDKHTHQDVFWEGQTHQTFVEFLSLSDKRSQEWRKNGIVTVQIRVMGKLHLENSFELTGCEDSEQASAK